MRNLNNLGRVRDALTISTNLIEMPRIPRSAKVSDQPDQQLKEDRGAWEHGTNRLRDTLLMWERWDLALRLAAKKNSRLLLLHAFQARVTGLFFAFFPS